jgi:hypothetical protein
VAGRRSSRSTATVRAGQGADWANFYDPEEIKRIYYPEVEQLLKDKLGASRIFVFDHNVRNATSDPEASPAWNSRMDRRYCGCVHPRGRVVQGLAGIVTDIAGVV